MGQHLEKCQKYDISPCTEDAVNAREALCKKYNIPLDGSCKLNLVTEIENKCVNMGFLEQTTKNIIGNHTCNRDSIDKFLADCRAYIPKYISSENGCTSPGLDEAKRLKNLDDNASAQREQASKESAKNRQAQQEAAEDLVEAQRESDRRRAREVRRLELLTKKQREEAQKKTEAMILSIVDPNALPPDLQKRALAEQNSSTVTYGILISVILLIIIAIIIFTTF